MAGYPLPVTLVWGTLRAHGSLSQRRNSTGAAPPWSEESPTWTAVGTGGCDGIVHTSAGMTSTAYHWTNKRTAAVILADGLPLYTPRGLVYVGRSPADWIGEVCFEIETTIDPWRSADNPHGQLREPIPPQRLRVVHRCTAGDEYFWRWVHSPCPLCGVPAVEADRMCGFDDLSQTWTLDGEDGARLRQAIRTVLVEWRKEPRKGARRYTIPLMEEFSRDEGAE
jgi:hypothetical protein